MNIFGSFNISYCIQLDEEEKEMRFKSTGWEEALERRDMCILMADSCCCMVETNTALQSNYLPFKNKSILSYDVKRL